MFDEAERKAEAPGFERGGSMAGDHDAFRKSFDLAPIGLAHVGPDGRWIAVNDCFCSMLGYTREELLQRRFQDLTHPDDLAQDVEYLHRMLSRDIDSYSMQKRYLRKDGHPLPVQVGATLVWDEVTQKPLYFIAAIEDIESRKSAEDELRQSRENLQFAVGAAQLGTFYCDWPLRDIVWNERCKEHFFLGPDETVDFDLFYALLHPEDRESVREAIERAVLEHRDYNVEYRVVGPKGQTRWLSAVGRFTYDAIDKPLRFDGITIDISERKQNQQQILAGARRDSVLGQIAQTARESLNQREIQSIAVRSLGQALKVDRASFNLIDIGKDIVSIEDDYYVHGLPSIAGRYPIADSHLKPQDYFPGAESLVIDDVQAKTFPERVQIELQGLDMRSIIAVPLLEAGRLVATLSVGMSQEPRVWSIDDVELVEAVASQTRSTVEAARLASERQSRLVRESLINRISAEARGSADPTEVQRRSVELLGEALSADRCYFVVYDPAKATMEITAEYSKPGLSSIVGVHPLTASGAWSDHPGPYTSVTTDAQDPIVAPATASNMRAVGLRSRMQVRASQSDGTYAAVVVGMASTARDWTAADVSFVESVVGQVRSALELAEVQNREHRIATQLQAALQPPVPRGIVGLDVEAVTRPALNEASIGGDFYDVFALDERRLALIVGDVSGKGLAAAAQLAAVRNLLRGLLYQHCDLAYALTSLNSILCAHDLITGFVTAFVGIFDTDSGAIEFSSCGHEPALIRRAQSSRIEPLSTGGAPLAAIESADFTVATDRLYEGDMLIIYTDGISESGQSRSELLGVEGLMNLVEQVPAHLSAKSAAESLVESVTQFSGAALRDDICLVVAKRLPASPKT